MSGPFRSYLSVIDYSRDAERGLSGRKACQITERLQALERLTLELTHPLASQVELVADRLERPRLALEA
jgi:hypothetical protein